MTKIVASGFITRRTALEPAPRERIVIGETGELVPVVVDGVDDALVGARQRAFELQIVGRVGEDEVDAVGGELGELLNAIADDDRIARRDASADDGTPNQAAASTRYLKLGGLAGRPGTGRRHERNHSTLLTGANMSHSK